MTIREIEVNDAAVAKMILFDLDDTLLTSEKYVSSDTVKAIYECKKRGLYIGYITARSPRKQDNF